MPSSDKTDIGNRVSPKPVVPMIVQEVIGQVSAIMWSDLKNRLQLPVQSPYDELYACWEFHVVTCIFVT